MVLLHGQKDWDAASQKSGILRSRKVRSWGSELWDDGDQKGEMVRGKVGW